MSGQMETPCECYRIADQCVQLANAMTSERARKLLLDVAATWRRKGDDLKADKAPSSNRLRRLS